MDSIREMKLIMLQTDYLIIGAGATAMAFVDELLHTSPCNDFIMIDNHAKPGGHWNDAYEFVTLHQPASYYGVKSKQLGTDEKDLVSKSQILAYYELVMKDFLNSGRVKFYSQCKYTGNDVFISLVEGSLSYKVKVRKKIVDSTYLMPQIPSIKKPQFTISDRCNFIPVNGLSRIQSAWRKYVIIGGGKTGIDAVLYLLGQKINPDVLTWIVPNEMWMVNRNFVYASVFMSIIKPVIDCMLECDNHEDLLTRWEELGYLMHLDANIKPTVMRGATVTVEEMETLRLVTNVVRRGRIKSIESRRIIFEDGSFINTDTDTLHVDCTASGIPNCPARKIFDGNNIILQSIKSYQPVFSASAIAALEYLPEGDDEKNEICEVIPHPQDPLAYITSFKQTSDNEKTIGKVLGFSWLRGNRLHPIHHLSFLDLFRLMIWKFQEGKKFEDKMKEIAVGIENIGNNEHSAKIEDVDKNKEVKDL